MRSVLLAARVVVKPSGFSGFMGFGENPTPKPWIFVVDEIGTSISKPA
jgi:hypothetical protein